MDKLWIFIVKMTLFVTLLAVSLLLAMALVFLLMGEAHCQVVKIQPSYLSSQKLVTDITYIGNTFPIGSISIKIKYDTSVYRMDSIVRQNQYITQGAFVYTSPLGNYDCFLISWFANNFNDTVYTDCKPMFTVYYSAKKEDCCYFNFYTINPWECEISDIDGNVMPCYFADTTICNLTTGIIQTMTSQKQTTQVYDLLGRPSREQGLYVKNRKLCYR